MDMQPDHESVEHQAPRSPRRRPRRRAVVAVAGLALGSAAVGGVTLADRSPAATTAGAASAQAGSAFSGGGSSYAPSTLGQTRRGVGGSSSWDPSSGSGPGSGSGSSLGDGRTASDLSGTTVSSTAQERGLVEVTSTLTDGTAAGTGMVLTSNGYVVTNHHVVEGATSVKVTVVATGRTYTARFVGADTKRDVAVLKLVGASGLSTVTMDSSALSVGAKVTAVGDANGDGGSLTSAPGTVSGLSTKITVQADDGTTHRLTGLVKVKADIVPGDSGGALLDSAGRVVGMNVAASTGSADVTGYDIPIPTVLSAVSAIEFGAASSSVHIGYDAFLGVGLEESTSTATIAELLSGGGAAQAGLTVGDTVTAVGGTPVGSAAQLRKAVARYAVGDRVRVAWTTSGGAHRSATVTLGRAPIA